MEIAAIREACSPPIFINPTWIDGESDQAEPTAEAAKSSSEKAPKKKGFEFPVARSNLSTGGLQLMRAIAVREPTDEAIAALQHWKFCTDVRRINADPDADDPRLIAVPLLQTIHLTAEEVEGNCRWEPLRGAGAGYAAIGTALDKEDREQKSDRSSQPWLIDKPGISLEAAYAQGIHSDAFIDWARYKAGTTYLSRCPPSDLRRQELIADVLFEVWKTDAFLSIEKPHAWLHEVIRHKFADLLDANTKIVRHERAVDLQDHGEDASGAEFICFAESARCSTEPRGGKLAEPTDLAGFPSSLKQIARLKLMGYTDQEIGHQLGIGESAVQKRLRRYGPKKLLEMSGYALNCRLN